MIYYILVFIAGALIGGGIMREILINSLGKATQEALVGVVQNIVNDGHITAEQGDQYLQDILAQEIDKYEKEFEEMKRK